MSKLLPSEVLYMEVPRGPLACASCVMWIKDVDRCAIHARDVEVTGDMICGLYVNGPPTTSEDAEPEGRVTAETSGLGAGRTSCGNCRWGDGQPRCQHPSLSGFAINNQNGCCNAWTKKGTTARESALVLIT